jgi:hypothetical protein
MAVYTTIDNPELYFQTKLYTGNGSTQSITLDGDTDMQPDWVWIKNRSSVTNHEVADSVRGVNKLLKPNDTDAEQSLTTKITSFDSDGFGVGTDANVNGSGNSLVAWNWKAGTSFTNDASATGIGTIDSTGSVNTDAGFSVISYTGNGSGGATVAHGLGSVPYMYIVKRRNSTGNWHTYHVSNGANGEIRLNLSEAFFTTDIWQDTAPTSSVFSLGSSIDVNASGGTYIGYIFSEVKGYSKFGSYTGNGNADGTFVYTGFKPAFVMAKKSSTTSSWGIFDNKRTPYNVMDLRLLANTSGADDQSSDNNIDFLSNGFKFRSSAGWNASATYIYMAFAENPFVTSTGVPATAR